MNSIRTFARRIWTEESAFLGLLGTVAVVVVKVATGDPITVEDVPVLLAPLGVGIAARGRN